MCYKSWSGRFQGGSEEGTPPEGLKGKNRERSEVDAKHSKVKGYTSGLFGGRAVNEDGQERGDITTFRRMNVNQGPLA